MSKATSTIGAIIGAIGAVLPALIKKKKHCLWYKGRDDKWLKKAGPMSARQCRKTIKALAETGNYLPDRFLILRDGVQP